MLDEFFDCINQSIGILFDFAPIIKLSPMKLKAVVKYLGEWAHYSIVTEASGVYHAHLDQYEGGNVLMPPKDVLLLKSANRWVGSYEETSFLQDLGKVIDEVVRGKNSSKV